VTRTPRVLVALVAETRAWQLTADSFYENVLDALDADLALCVRADEPHNPFYDRTKYMWTFHESGDWAEAYRRAVGSDDWRCLLEIGDFFMGGIEDPEHPQVASAAILHYYRSLLGRRLEENGLIDEYDWVIVSRSDLMWPHPHPPVRHLSCRHIHFLDGEQYGGVTDRHAIVPRRYVPAYTSLTDPVFDDPIGLKERIDVAMEEEGWTLFNIERFLAWRLKELGLWRRVRYVPYMPYAVRVPGPTASWNHGVFDEELGYYVKYPTERERSEIAGRFVTDEDSWRLYLAPVRGARQRGRLEAAYHDRGLYERAFTRPPVLNPFLQRTASRVDHGLARIGRELRKVPGMPTLLDARLERLRARAERRRQMG
jgi:hypothetical protein